MAGVTETEFTVRVPNNTENKVQRPSSGAGIPEIKTELFNPGSNLAILQPSGTGQFLLGEPTGLALQLHIAEAQKKCKNTKIPQTCLTFEEYQDIVTCLIVLVSKSNLELLLLIVEILIQLVPEKM